MSTEDPLKARRAREERKQIVEKYDKGREEGAKIDDWEDPKYEIYHMQDRYGFIHDTRLPEVGTRTGREKKMLDKEMSRLDKWLIMITEKDKKLGRIHSKEVRQIDLDVNRTYRDHIMFRERYNIKQGELFHVLTAYSLYNSEVGYCQGMSQLAALLLMFFPSDEDAFWGLHQLMVNEKYNFHGFYIPSFPKLQRFQNVHDKVMLKKLKKVQKHLISNGMDTGIYAIKWFLQCYLDRIPFTLLLRVWDIFLLEGDIVILAMAYNIFKLHQKSILKMDMNDLMIFLSKTLESDFGFDDDIVIMSLNDCLNELTSTKFLSEELPEEEKPQKPFGVLDKDVIDVELVGERLEVNEGDRQFLRNTLQREQDVIAQIRHIDSADSIDNIDENEEDDDDEDGDHDASLDKSLSFQGDLSDNSIDKEDEFTPTREKYKFNPMQSTFKKLDDSLEFLLDQADISDKKNKLKLVSVDIVPLTRPASAGPISRSESTTRKQKSRMSAYIPTDHGVTTLTSSHSRPCSSAQLRTTSQSRLNHYHSDNLRHQTPQNSSSSSREINISSDSTGPDSGRNSANKPPAPASKLPQRLSSSSQKSPHSHNSSRSGNKNSYFFGESPSSRK